MTAAEGRSSAGRRGRLRIAVRFVAVVAVAGVSTLAPTVGARADAGNTGSPTPPPVPGCYKADSTAAAGGVTGPVTWVPVPCVSADTLAGVPRPLEGGGSGVPGVWSRPKPIIPGFSFSPPIEGASVVVTNLSGSVETDTGSGPGAFSIQTNTNNFAGLNGHTDWVQFTDQTDFNNAAPNLNVACIWNVDITVASATNNTQGYSPNCVSVPGGPRGGFWQLGQPADVTGSTRIGPFGEPLLTLVALLPWTNSSYYAVVTGDTYGLTWARWRQVSGTILGIGGGSEALFSRGTMPDTPVQIATTVDARSCFPSGPNCPTFPLFELQGYGTSFTGVVTAETNNLSLLRPPALACSGYDCALNFISTY